MNDLVMRAILAMDSYNRGYNRKIKLPSTRGTKIGDATIFRQSRTEKNSPERKADFYAIAYVLNDQKVISYRGTDKPYSFPFGGDIINGWLQGAGYLTPQSEFAADFYEFAVFPDGIYEGTAVLTGHSLGGGLAGFIASLYGKEASIFDNMAFERSARRAYDLATTLPIDFTDSDELARFNARNTFFDGASPQQSVDFLNIRTHAVEGEVLAANRILQEKTPTTPYALVSDADLSRTDKHSMAALALLIYAEDSAHADWEYAASDLWKFLYNEDFSKSLGYDDSVFAKGTADDALRSIIAYSAIDVGSRVFGDTGIRSLFDDAANLGRFSKFGDSAGEYIRRYLELITKHYISYAGKLALKKVLSGNVPNATEGVLEVYGDALAIDLSDQRWNISGEVIDNNLTFDQDQTLSALQLEMNEEGDINAFAQSLIKLWKGQNPTQSFNRLVMGGFEIISISTIEELEGSSPNKTIYAGVQGIDDVTLVGTGDHLIYGNDGNDAFVSNEGKNFILGGKGEDTVSYNQKVVIEQEQLSKKQKADGQLYIEKTTYGTQDILRDIERLILSQDSDEVALTSDSVSDIKVEIDANNKIPGDTRQAGVKDTLDLEALSTGVRFAGSGYLYSSDGSVNLNPDLNLKNFEIFKYGSGDDVHNYAGGITEFHEVDLGAGNDVLINARRGSTITTGIGDDAVALGDNIRYDDLSSTDRIALLPSHRGNGNYLTGGTKPADDKGLDSQWVLGSQGEQYAYNQTGQLVIKRPDGALTFIEDAKTGPNVKKPTAGIALGEITFEAFRLLDGGVPSDWFEQNIDAAKFIYRTRNGVEYGEDPLVLDMDGDGIELTSLSISGPRFDLDGDNFAELTGWVHRDDALLVHDKNSNGTIDSIDELFGYGSISGFEELRALNTNGDEWFSSSDDAYDRGDIVKSGVRETIRQPSVLPSARSLFLARQR